MLEFTDLVQNAIKLSSRVSDLYKKNPGCVNFFKGLATDVQAEVDACTISMIAKNLHTSSVDEDDLLIRFLQKQKTDLTLVELSQLKDFKAKVIIGAYLTKWCQHENLITLIINNPFLGLLREDLSIDSLGELGKVFFEQCLDAFSNYCTYVYDNRQNETYLAMLNTQLGDTIQLDIRKVRRSKTTEDTGWPALFNTSMGMKL